MQDCLRESLETELDQCEEDLRSTHGNKMAELKQEMEQLEQKLSSARDSLVAELEEQEKAVELKQTALTTLESELENKVRRYLRISPCVYTYVCKYVHT